MRHIVTRREWGAQYRDGFGYAPIPAREVWLHHTAGPARNGSGIIRELERVGQRRFGGGMSYPFLVTPDGTPYEGLSIDRQGAHTGGRNDISRAICVVGNYENRYLTDAQFQTIVDLLREGAKRGWWVEPQLTGGHRDLKATACPGDHAYNVIGQINKRAASKARSSKSRMGDEMPAGTIAPGKHATKLVYPIGPSVSILVKRGWLSLAGSEDGSAHVWTQGKGGNAYKEWDVALEKDKRWFVQLPDGVDQITVHSESQGPIGWCLELEPR